MDGPRFRTISLVALRQPCLHVESFAVPEAPGREAKTRIRARGTDFFDRKEESSV